MFRSILTAHHRELLKFWAYWTLEICSIGQTAACGFISTLDDQHFRSPSSPDLNQLSSPPSSLIISPQQLHFLHTSKLPILICSHYFHSVFPPLFSKLWSALTSLCISSWPPLSACFASLPVCLVVTDHMEVDISARWSMRGKNWSVALKQQHNITRDAEAREALKYLSNHKKINNKT